MEGFLLYFFGGIFYFFIILPFITKIFKKDNFFLTLFFYLITIGGFILYFVIDGLFIKIWYTFISFPSVMIPIISYFTKRKDVQKEVIKKDDEEHGSINKFIDIIFETDFPGGAKQIESEADLINFGLNEEKLPKEDVKKILIRGTAKVYLEMLNKNEFSVKHLANYLQENFEISKNQATFISLHIFLKNKSK